MPELVDSWRILHEATCLCGSGEWRILSPIGTAFNTTATANDAPVRLMRWNLFSMINTITPGELP